MNKHKTQTITIYQKSYQIPVLTNTYFQRLQTQIQESQAIIKQQPSSQTLLNQNFQESEKLVQSYDNLISLLTEHKLIYQQFFTQLTQDLREIVENKFQEAEQQEQKRLALIKDETNPELLNILEIQKEQILGNLWLFGKAFLLMLKKLELIYHGIEEIALKQEQKRKILSEMTHKLKKWQKIYDLQLEINQSTKEANLMVENAVNLEDYLHPFIGSFQGLIEQVYQEDNRMIYAVSEIKDLVRGVMTSQTEILKNNLEENLSIESFDFLIDNHDNPQKQCLLIAVEQCQMQCVDQEWEQFDCSNCEDLTRTIFELHAHIDGQLEAYNFKSYQLSVIPKRSRRVDNRHRISDVHSFLGRTLTNTEDEQAYLNSPLTYRYKASNNPFCEIPQNSTTELDLKSKRNLNYHKLQQLLAQQNWREADKETETLMLQAMSKSEWYHVSIGDLLNFPIADFQTIDQLWFEASNGKFSFSVQKQIWLDCGGKLGEYQEITADKFGDCVGWFKNDSWSYSNLIYSSNAPKGHLPTWRFGGWDLWGVLGVGVRYLFHLV